MKRLVMAVMVLAAMTVGQAATYTWDGGGSDNSWTTVGNWSSDNNDAPNGPTGTGKVYIQPDSPTNVVMGSDVDVSMSSHLYFGDGTLTVNGGTLNSRGGYGMFGYSAGDVGTPESKQRYANFQWTSWTWSWLGMGQAM